jgi:hypothetical protein
MRSFVLESMATSGSSIRPSWAEEPDWAEASPWISERITFESEAKLTLGTFRMEWSGTLAAPMRTARPG